MYKTLKRIFLSTLVGSFVVILEGCAVTDAIEGVPEKNLNVLQPGTHRDLVRAELGEPHRSVEGPNCEAYSFAKGTSGWRYLRAFGYTIVDIGTLGIGEVVTNPLEKSFATGEVRLRVCYDSDQRVLYSERIETGDKTTILTGASPIPKADKATAGTGSSGSSKSDL